MGLQGFMIFGQLHHQGRVAKSLHVEPVQSQVLVTEGMLLDTPFEDLSIYCTTTTYIYIQYIIRYNHLPHHSRICSRVSSSDILTALPTMGLEGSPRWDRIGLFKNPTTVST